MMVMYFPALGVDVSVQCAVRVVILSDAQRLLHTSRARAPDRGLLFNLKFGWRVDASVSWSVFTLDTRCLCALCRYLGRKKCVQSVCVQPPFLRPQLTEAQLAAKILDNGIQGDLHRVRTGRLLKFCSSCCNSVSFKSESETRKMDCFGPVWITSYVRVPCFSESVYRVYIQAAPDGSQRFKSCSIFTIQKSYKFPAVNTSQPRYQPRQTAAS